MNRYDLIIVGGGMVGLQAADAACSAGMRVLLMEAGREQSVRSKESGIRVVSNVTHTGQHYQYQGIGGASGAWGGQVIRYHDFDFSARDWVPGSGWPISREDLGPFYRAAEKRLGVSRALASDMEDQFRSATGEMVSVPGVAGASSVFVRHPDYARKLRRRLFRQRNCKIELGHPVVYLDVSEAGQPQVVSHVDGTETLFSAPNVLLATGCFGATRIMLSSRSHLGDSAHPSFKQIGLNYHDHVTGTLGRLTAIDESTRRSLVVSQGMRRRSGHRNLPRFVPTLSEQESRDMLVSSFLPVWEWADSSFAAYFAQLARMESGQRSISSATALARAGLWHPLRSTRLWAGKVLGPLYSETPDGVRIHFHSEQEPLNRNSVVLSGRVLQSGQPELLLDWNVSRREQVSISSLSQTAANFYETLGFGRWIAANQSDDWRDNKHPAGTLRMSRLPTDGVVDPECRLHALSSVYIASSAVFPTGSHANPTLTTLALALRAVDMMVRSR